MGGCCSLEETETRTTQNPALILSDPNGREIKIMPQATAKTNEEQFLAAMEDTGLVDTDTIQVKPIAIHSISVCNSPSHRKICKWRVHEADPVIMASLKKINGNSRIGASAANPKNSSPTAAWRALLRTCAAVCAGVSDASEAATFVLSAGKCDGAYYEVNLRSGFEATKITGQDPCYFLFAGERASTTLGNQIVFCSDIDFTELMKMNAGDVQQKLEFGEIGFYRLIKPKALAVKFLGCLTCRSHQYFWPFHNYGVLLMYPSATLKNAILTINNVHRIGLFNVESPLFEQAIGEIGPMFEIVRMQFCNYNEINLLRTSHLIFWQESPRDTNTPPADIVQGLRLLQRVPSTAFFLRTASKSNSISNENLRVFDGNFHCTITVAQVHHLILYGLLQYHHRRTFV